MVNVTPATPPTYPITYTYGGQVFNIASLSGLGCADTVYSTTYNGTAYINYVVLPANQALTVVQAYEAQFALPNIACSTLVTQASLLNGQGVSGVPTTNGDIIVLGNDLNTFSGVAWFVVELIVIVVLVLILIWAVIKAVELVGGKGRR